MTTLGFITQLFCRVDDKMTSLSKPSQADLYPSEVVTLGILFALKGVGNRAFYRWLEPDFKPLFPRLPERSRLFRLLATHQDWTQHFLAEPTVLGVADSYGIELVHPKREGRSKGQIGNAQRAPGKSNWRCVHKYVNGIIGGKLGSVLNQFGLIVSWTCDTANVHDSAFPPLIAQFVRPATGEQEATVAMVVLTDTGFHAKEGDPINRKICPRGSWNARMLVETVLSMLTTVCHRKKVGHRAWVYFGARLAFVMAAFNPCATWHGLVPDEDGFIRLSIAEFSL